MDTLFRNTPQVFDKLKDMYLGSMLASYLTFQPQTANLNVELVLDTNFIVSLLDLNTVESTKNCKTLIDVGKRLGYSFTVLQDTIVETQGLLSFKSAHLDKAIIAKNINREDIYNACDRRNLNSVDLDRISDNLEETLFNYGFRIIPHTNQWHGKVRYSKEYSILRELRNSKKAAFHDALAIVYVREKRGNRSIKDFDKVNCWFVNNAINHDCDHDAHDLDELTKTKNDAQPEIIKVDDLLNILWLSNPNVGIDGKDIVDTGIMTLVSYTLNSSLPKTRIIRELDENIQKYRKDCSITDTDVMRLSTRIANKQIKDIQALNKLADNDASAFAAKVKEESEKQAKIDQERAQKFDSLVNVINESIKDLRDNKEKLNARHEERMDVLAKRETELELRSQELSKKEVEITTRKRNEEREIKRLVEENEKDKCRLRTMWEKENRERREKRQNFIEIELSKWRRTALGYFILGIILILGVIALWWYVCVCLPNENNKFIVGILSSSWTPSIITIIIGFTNVYTISHYYNCRLNPSYETSKRIIIEEKMADSLKDITFEDYLKDIDSRKQ